MITYTHTEDGVELKDGMTVWTLQSHYDNSTSLISLKVAKHPLFGVKLYHADSGKEDWVSVCYSSELAALRFLTEHYKQAAVSHYEQAEGYQLSALGYDKRIAELELAEAQEPADEAPQS